MELSENMSLGDLKKAIKDFKKTAPKLTSRKSDLMAFAQSAGLIKKKEVEVSEPVVEKVKAKTVAVPQTPKPVATTPKKVLTSELPKELKKPTVSEPAKKAVSPFAAFMAANRGRGLSMAQLADAYRGQKC